MKKITLTTFTCILLTLFYSPILYSGEVKGKIVSLKGSGVNAAVLVKINSEIIDTPRCNELNVFSINFASPSATYVFELVKLAFKENLTVYIEGLGTCSSYWKAEDIKEVTLFY